MTTDFIAELTAEKSQLRLERIFREMEHQLTPLELKAVLPKLDAQGGFLGQLVASSAALELVRREAPETFVATDFYPGIRLYSDPSVRKEDKALLICLRDNSALLLIPTGQFLQFIPAKKFDVLTLADEMGGGYENGAGAVRGVMPEWVLRVADEFELQHYRDVYCFGVSMGGFPALRAGPMLGAKRSISVAGTPAWPIRRLLAGERVHAFDPLCVCGQRVSDRVVVFSAGHVRDANCAELVRRSAGARLIAVESKDHNTMQALFLAGQLHSFLGAMFDFEAKPQGPAALPPRPKARKTLHHHVRRLLQRLGLKKNDPVRPEGFVRPAANDDRTPRR